MNEAQRLDYRRNRARLASARPYFRELAREAEKVRLRAIGVRTPCGSGGAQGESMEENEVPEKGNDERDQSGDEPPHSKGRQDARDPSDPREEGLGTPIEDSTDRSFRGGNYR